jgi:phosphohistidine phosphatase SixA
MILHVLIAALTATAFSSLASHRANASEAAVQALREGAIVLIRHARAPGVGDPDNFKLEDCSTQRNLNDQGRAEARRIGKFFRDNGIEVSRVLSSEWCRCLETAELAFPGRVTREPSFNSFFQERASEAVQTARGQAVLMNWRGPGTLVVVTHQVNITALTGVFPAEGEGVVLRVRDGRIEVIGRIKP